MPTHATISFSLVNNYSNTNELSPYCQRLMNSLIELATQSGSYNIENNVSLGCFFTIGTIAEHFAHIGDLFRIEAAYIKRLGFCADQFNT